MKRIPLIKKLHIKFIALNMGTIAVVLAVTFVSICLIDYQQSLQKVYASLDAAVSHADDGHSDDIHPDGDTESNTEHGQPGWQPNDNLLGAPASELDGKKSLEESAAPADTPNSASPPEIGGQPNGTGQNIPVAVYRLSGNEFATTAISLSTATLSTDTLAQAANQLSSLPDGAGTLDDVGLYYDKRSVGNATYVAFADMSATSQWKSLALTLALVGIGALAVLFVISLFFSRWALRPAAQAWERQRHFVADASHDLKTPLTVILANTSILKEHPERSVASQSQWVESTQHEAEHMQELVEDLLLLAQLDEDEDTGASESVPKSTTGRKPLEKLDLSDLAEGELLEFESVAYERGISLEQDISPNVAVRGNTARLRRLVAALIDNACKYAGRDGTVSVALHPFGKQAKLTVHNTGMPIAPEDLPHVFDRFYRTDKARTRNLGGHGLGLAIARAIAEEHGGTLTATSTAQEGTTFTATLPLAVD